MRPASASSNIRTALADPSSLGALLSFLRHFLIIFSYKKLMDERPLDYGVRRMDHIVGNTWNMKEAVDRVKKWLGFHTFAFFTKEDIQTEYTSLNSEVRSPTCCAPQ